MRASIVFPAVFAVAVCGAVTPLPVAAQQQHVSLSSMVVRAVDTTDAYRPVWATRNIDKPVIDGAGGHVGLLRDFVVDLGTGEVRGAVISVYRGPVESIYVVPVQRMRSTDQGILLEGSGAAPLQNVAFAQTPATRHASGLIGIPVQDVVGRDLGEVVDMVIDPDRQRMEHLMVRFVHPQMGTIGKHTFAVPVESLASSGTGGGRLAVNVRQEHFAGLMGPWRVQTAENTVRYLGSIDMASRALPNSVPDAVGATR